MVLNKITRSLAAVVCAVTTHLSALVVVVLLPIAGAASSATITADSDTFYISGEIRPGDAELFRRISTRDENLYISRVFLQSKGGDVTEALKIAHLVDRSFMTTWLAPGSECFSACFLIWAAGVQRALLPTSVLGVHRMALKDPSADVNRARNLISPMAVAIDKYLLELGMPRALVARMWETPASDMYKFDYLEARTMGWTLQIGFQPTFFDAVERVCGRQPDPWYGNTIRERPRESETMAKIADWVQCMTRVRVRNRLAFVLDDMAAFEMGKPSLLVRSDNAAHVKAWLR